jgi:hypothetical protein
MALKLDIAANTRLAQSQVKDLGEALEDVADALDDVAKDGDKAGGKLEKSFRDMVRDADKATRDMGDAADKIGRDYEDAGRDIKKGVGAGLDDVKSEAGQSGREAAASFSGEWTDVGDFVQETVANGFSGFGPIGAAAGIAAAAGIGVITQTILGQQEAADELKARLSSAYQTAAEEGRTYLDTAQIIAEASDLMFNKDRAEEWKQVQEDAKTLGMDVYDVIAANAGESSKQRDVQERINALVEEQLATGKETEGIVGNVALGVQGIKRRWDDVIKATDTERERAEALTNVVKRSEEEHRGQINRTADTASRRYEGLARQYGADIRATVRYDVDDSAVRNYMPPRKLGAVQYLPSTRTDRWV